MLWQTSKTHHTEERELGKSEIQRVKKKNHCLLPPSLLCLGEIQIAPAHSKISNCTKLIYKQWLHKVQESVIVLLCSKHLKNRNHMTY